MEYSKFLKLVGEGEKDTVDFKIQSDAFATKTVGDKGELAKDICALANNGNRASYLIIGVSNDRKSFKSVINRKLTDDNLQTFCKTAIFPPPKVQLTWCNWPNARPVHKGVDFVVIQVGPQPRQVFRFNQNFIDYQNEICFRRNEVWIRRRATSDLATPEEIARLVNGESLQEDEEDSKRKEERKSFDHLSRTDQVALIDKATGPQVRKAGYESIRPSQQLKDDSHRYTWSTQKAVRTKYKKKGTTLIFLTPLDCCTSLTVQDLRFMSRLGYFGDRYTEWANLPTYFQKLTRRSVRAVRIIWLVPVIGAVSPGRIVKVFPKAAKIGASIHYYQSSFRDYGYKDRTHESWLPSSNELLIIDRIQSVSDYREMVQKGLVDMEPESEVILIPPPRKVSGQ